MSTYYSPERIAAEWKAVETYHRLTGEHWLEASRCVAAGDIEGMHDHEDWARNYQRLGEIQERRAEAITRDEIPEGVVT